MCGITAFCGREEALPFLLQGLEKLEYRGYDSAGITLINNDLLTIKVKGRLQNLKDQLDQNTPSGHVGIGHTRWATHGVPSNLNSHPHTNNDNTISIVHNGIIENYRELKDFLISKGYQFNSETDSEVIVHLLDYYYQDSVFESLKKVIKDIDGSYALCIVSTLEPENIYITKKDSPIVIGKTKNACFAASDIPAILDYTKDVYFLEDYEIAKLTSSEITFYNEEYNIINKQSVNIPYSQEAAKKGGYDTFMLKEIYEQPNVLKETLRGRISNNNEVLLEELDDLKDKFKTFNKVYFVACGTAYHASLLGASVLEKLTGLITFCQVASEFRYNDPIIDEKTLTIFVSQSGETADTLAALRLAKQKGATTIAIANVLGSTISRDADNTIYTCAGPEIAVASTKAYTTQLATLLLFCIYVAQELNIRSREFEQITHELIAIPDYISQLLKNHKIFENYANYFKDARDAFFIGRGLDYASVLEGALKLKEVSYIHADAYIAGELKHGPIALIEDGSVIIAVATQPHIAAKTISNIQETIARGAKVILFTLDSEIITNVSETFIMPNVSPILQPILIAIPLQLIAYYSAKLKGCDVDKPRNLAKSVTVE